MEIYKRICQVPNGGGRGLNSGHQTGFKGIFLSLPMSDQFHVILLLLCWVSALSPLELLDDALSHQKEQHDLRDLALHNSRSASEVFFRRVPLFKGLSLGI
jgi:hypothetical protein